MKSLSRKYFGRKGVALITVLIFMTIATIAATAVYKLLASENLSSAARLRQNEAYQASQAGLNLARAWLSYNGSETASLITQFARDGQHRPISLNERMRQSGLQIQQDFSVLLASVDTVSSNGVKVKLISTGKGRVGSSYSQVAILNVEGLYRVDIPSASGDVDYNAAYFGGSLSYAGAHAATAMMVNGNWDGNPLKVTKDFYITGNVDLSGNEVDIGGTGCIGGDMLAGNGLKVGSIYVDGDALGKLRDVSGDAYFNGNVDATNADFTVVGNFYAGGSLKTDPSAHDAIFQNNFCMGDYGRIVFGSGIGHEFRVQNNVWLPNTGAMSGTMSEANALEKKFGMRNESQVYISEMYMDVIKDGYAYLHQEGDFISGLWGAITGEYNWRYFVSKSENRVSSVAGEPPFDCADSLPTFCHKKWHPAEGCDGTKYKIDDLLTTAYDSFEQKANQVDCAKDIKEFTGGSSTVESLNACYEKAAKEGDANLYNGFLVVKFTANSNAYPTGTLNGKFIIIYENDGSSGGYLRLPPSTGTTMVYLKEGASGNVDQSVVDPNATYNYFIYTKADIGQMLTGSSPWKGSVYAEAENCAKLGKVQGGISLEYDPKVVNALVNAKVICKAGTNCGDSGDGEVDESGNVVSTSAKDKNWIALAPTLKISLMSQYANSENVSVENHEMEKGVLVMPRVIYLNTGDRLVNGSERAYNVIYLGGLEPSGSGSASCYFGEKLGSGVMVSETSTFDSEGLYTCQYSEGDYTSDFWVWVMDASSSAKVSLDTLNYNLSKVCESVGIKTKKVGIKLLTEHSISGGYLNILVYEKSNGATVTPLTSSSGLFTLTDLGPSSGGELYKLELKEGISSMTDPLFDVSIFGGCASASGYVQFQLLDPVSTDNLGLASPGNELVLLGDGAGPVAHHPINEDETVSDSIKSIPECTAYNKDDVVWTPSVEGCYVASGIEPDAFYGPWLCPMSSVVSLSVSNNVDERICKPYFGSSAVVESPNDTAFVYASLKKTPYTLSIEIEGLMGTANVYGSQGEVSLGGKTKEELENDAEVELLNENDEILGTCRTGGVLYKDGKNIGPCDITVYYGQHYYVRAKGKYFDHWSYYCDSKSPTFACGTATGASTKSRLIAVTISEDVTVKANYTKTGYCFNEDFKHLHPYCDYEVTPKAIGGLSFARLPLNSSGYTDFYRTDVRNSAEKRTISKSQYEDYGHGDGEYCIDQCVTNWKYRYSELAYLAGKELEGIGTKYDYYFDFYCSVEGKTAEGTVREKESEAADVWSYYDPGISCEDQVDRAFDDWKMPWTYNVSFNLTKEGAKKNCHDTYRCVSGANNNSSANTLDCRGKHPPSLDKPRVYGGYYPQNDPYSPWLKVLSVNISQMTKYGARRSPDKHNIKLDIDDAGETAKSVNQSYWNIKPYIDREDGFASQHGTKTSFIILRKEKAGYNGTYTKTFTWNGTGESNDGGSISAIIFRSNADATSFFLLGINPSASTTDATQRHFILCHGTERQMFNETAVISGSQIQNDAREMQYPLNTGHCIAEEVFANLPWDYIKQRTLQLKVELDGPNAKITFSYTNQTTANVGTGSELFDGTNSTIYISKTFNLEDPALFGYPIDDDHWSERLPKVDAAGNSTHIYQNPIEHMKNNNEDYGYVGFVVHNQNEKIYNLNWRSGGSCGGDYREEPGTYCGFESAEVTANTHTVPIRYVYDYCPDQGECRCTYKYSLNGGSWIDEKNFILPPEGRKYPYGSLRVLAECYDENNPTGKTYKDSTACNGFTTVVEGGENVCYDNYTIFNYYNTATVLNQFTLYNSEIAGINNYYRTRIKQNAGEIGDAIREKLCVDTEDMVREGGINEGAASVVGESHYSASNFCSATNSTSGTKHGLNANITVDGVAVRVHPKENNINKQESSDKPNQNQFDTGNLMMVGHGPDADPYDGVTANFLQLIDTIDNTNTKRYLNLKGSDITFRLYQNNLVDDIRIYVEDDNGVQSKKISLDEDNLAEDESSYLNNLGSITQTLNRQGDYCNIYDHRITADEYNNLGSEEREKYYQELCQLNLVWVRDLKRFARGASEQEGHTWSGMFPFRQFRVPISKLVAGTTADPTRISKIYFEVENDRGGGIHISQLKTDCPTSLDVLNCKTSWNGVENNANKTVREGQNILFSANVPGATYCQLRLHQNGSNTTYSDIKGWPEDEWFPCNNAEQYFKTDSLGLTCENTATDCEARFTVVAKNSSDELDSCMDNSKNGLYVKVQNTKYTCYGYNTNYTTGVAKTPDYKSEVVNSLFTAEPIEYDGSGSVSMGLDFNGGSFPRPTTIKLIGPDGQVIEEIEATSSGSNAEKYARCAQWKEGTTTHVDGTTSYPNLKNDCAFFQFNPTKYGTGDYKLVMGNSNVDACKINITVPARKLENCIVSQTTVNKDGYVDVVADGEYLDGTVGSLKVGSDTHACRYEPESEGATRGMVLCDFKAPSTGGDYGVTLNFAGLSLDCGTLAVTDKPKPSDCKVSGDGRFNAKVNNPKALTYKYRLIRCDDLLGNNCTFETDGAKQEGTSMSESILLNVGKPVGGRQYTYFFQVSTSGDFERDVEACYANYNFEGVNAECDVDKSVVGVGQSFNFIAKNAEGLADDTDMSIMEGTTKVGDVLLKADGTGNTAFMTATKKGSHEYTLVGSDGKNVCRSPATVNVVGVTANTCNFQLADWPNTTVDKVMSKIKVAWQPDKRTKVKFAASDFQNLSVPINAKLLCSKGGHKLEHEGLNMPLSSYSSVVLSEGFDVPEITDDMTCVLSYDGDEVCRATISIAKPMGDAECKVGNDNNGGIGRDAPADNIGIQNEMKTPNTHFYFYYKKDKGEISSFKVKSPPSGNKTYDVQEDDNSRYDLGCPDHEVNGYECVTVYPGMNCRLTNNYWEANYSGPCGYGWTCSYKCEGFVPSTGYKYTLCTTLPGYYSGESGEPVSCCTKTLEIGNW
ncbi:MAG: hypothetical protein MJY87_04505 [Fibrobacter sp.]|nr:hypothetical protein [Fibrobacter sp.]